MLWSHFDYTGVQGDVRTHTHTHTETRTHTHTERETHTHTHTHTHTQVFKEKYARTRHQNVLASKCRHAHTHTHIQRHTHTHIQTDRQTHTHIHTHTHAVRDIPRGKGGDLALCRWDVFFLRAGVHHHRQLVASSALVICQQAVCSPFSCTQEKTLSVCAREHVCMRLCVCVRARARPWACVRGKILEN